MVSNHFKFTVFTYSSIYVKSIFINSLLLEMKTDEAFSTAQQFYKDLGDIAVEKGYAWILLLYVCCWEFTVTFYISSRVTVSVVTIKGEECRVMELGQVVDATGGDVSTILILVY